MKPRHLHHSEDCRAVSTVLQRVGDKWTVLVVSKLGGGRLRFSELRDAVGGISQKMLTATLRGLERDGFVVREQFPTIPPRVEYELTDLGRELLEPVTALGRMGAPQWRTRRPGAGAVRCVPREAGRRSRPVRRSSKSPVGRSNGRPLLRSYSTGTGFGRPSPSSATMTKSALVTRSIRSVR